MPKHYKTKKANNGTKTTDPKKKKKDDKSFTTLRENHPRRPTEEELKYMLQGPGYERFIRELPKVVKAREAMEKRNPSSGKKMPGGGHAKKAPMFMMGGKTYADMGAMIKAEAGSLIAGLAKTPKTRAQMEAAVGKK